MCVPPTVLQGLRTLVLASRVLSEAEYIAWDASYREAAGSLDDREARIAVVSPAADPVCTLCTHSIE